MYCEKCKAPLTMEDKFCKRCGAIVNQQTVPQTNVVQPVYMNGQNNINNTPYANTQNLNNNLNIPSTPVQPNNLNSGVTPVLNSTPQFINSTPIPEPSPVQPTSMQIPKIVQPDVNFASQPTQNLGQVNNEPQLNAVEPPQSLEQASSTNLNNNSNNNLVTSNQFPKKNNRLLIIIIGGVVVIALVIGIVLMLQNNESNSSNNSSNEVVINKTVYKTKIGNFTFEIPEDYMYQNINDGLYICDYQETWATFILPTQGSYEMLKANMNMIKETLNNSGITASEPQVKTIGGIEFILLECSMEGENIVFAYTKANSSYVFGIEAYSIDNNFDYSGLENIIRVLQSAEYSTSKTNMKMDTNLLNKIDLEEIFK